MTVPVSAAAPVDKNERDAVCEAVGRGVFPTVGQCVSVQVCNGCLAVYNCLGVSRFPSFSAGV